MTVTLHCTLTMKSSRKKLQHLKNKENSILITVWD